VKSAGTFHERLGLTGVILTKMDGDARGGAALSIRWVTGQPIKFIGTGEKYDALEPFQPDRVVGRILGMGDVLTLIEKAEESIDKEKAEELEEKLRRAEFTLEDFRDQLRQLKKMGPLDDILGMIPGVAPEVRSQGVDERKLGRVEAIINSMTPQERRRPDVLNGKRRKRIARGSGTSVQEVNQLLRQYGDMKKMMKAVTGGGKKDAMRKLAARFGGKMKLPL
jgi:signal recognition particle subunit SRP54